MRFLVQMAGTVERPCQRGGSASDLVPYLEHFHTARLHQGIGHRILRPGEETGRKDGPMAIRERCCGILKNLYRVAA